MFLSGALLGFSCGYAFSDLKLMERVHLSGKKPLGLIIAIVCIAAAVGTALYVEYDSYHHPETDSGILYADTIHVGALVGGRLQHLPIRANQLVHKGDLLYQIDPEPYIIALHQAEANLNLAQANLEEAQRQLNVRIANAQSSVKRLHQAEDERDLHARTVTRLKPLAEKHYISWQEYDQELTKLNSANDALTEARHSDEASHIAVGDLKRSQASRDEAQVAVEHARYNLRQTTVHATADGYITSLTVKEGEVLAPNQVLFTIVTNDEWYAIANIREINLKPVKPGACATVYSMIDRHTPIRGHVESIGWGVMTDDMKSQPQNVPYVQRQMDWVHVSQRFPVRIRLDPSTAPDLLRMGATADVKILYGAACH